MKYIVYSIIIILLFAPLYYDAQQEIPKGIDTVRFLTPNAAYCNDLRLHLGCGETHLAGYINIDFAPTQHPLQAKSGADFFCDITQLSLPGNVITEVRSHHTFEHFNRQTSLAFLAAWHYWLIDGGIVTIETPDFYESIQQLLNADYSYQQKQIIMRHIFGSHEASWANHYDGWYEEKFKHILEAFGFSIHSCEKSDYLVLRNITIQAQKKYTLSIEELRSIGHQLLKENMTDDSISEKALWNIWCNEFNSALNTLCREQY
jgi:predicted SAM-dependent methyltransferase